MNYNEIFIGLSIAIVSTAMIFIYINSIHSEPITTKVSEIRGDTCIFTNGDNQTDYFTNYQDCYKYHVGQNITIAKNVYGIWRVVN